MRGEQLDVVPILGQAVLEFGHGALAGRDLGLDAFELGRLLLDLCRRLLLLGWSQVGSRTQRRAQLVAPTDVLGPAAVVRIEMSVLDRKGPLNNSVEQRPIMSH